MHIETHDYLRRFAVFTHPPSQPPAHQRPPRKQGLLYHKMTHERSKNRLQYKPSQTTLLQQISSAETSQRIQRSAKFNSNSCGNNSAHFPSPVPNYYLQAPRVPTLFHHRPSELLVASKHSVLHRSYSFYSKRRCGRELPYFPLPINDRKTSTPVDK